MIKIQEVGMPTVEVCRRHGLSPASFYKFRGKFGGMSKLDTHRCGFPLRIDPFLQLALTPLAYDNLMKSQRS
jgi:hypothetical protein